MMRAMSRLALSAVPVTVAAMVPALVPLPFALTDHLIFWQAGHRVATGGSPYPIAPWAELAARYPSAHIQMFLDAGVGVWVYPPWTAYLFAPFGALPVTIGPWALHLAYLGAGLGAVLWWARLLPWRRSALLALALACGVVFEPLVIAARYGQFTGFLLAGAVLTAHGLRSGRTLPLLLGAFLLAAKPQLGAGLLLLAVVLLLRRGQGRTLAAVAGSLLAVVAWSVTSEPASVAAVTTAAGQRIEAFGLFATTWSLAKVLAGPFAVPLALAQIGFVAAACVIAARRAPPELRTETQVSAALTLTLAMTPYALPYDQALLLPSGLLAIALLGRADGAGRATWLTLAVTTLVGLPWLLFVGFGWPALGILPVLVAAVVLAGVLRDPAATRSAPR